MFRKSEVPANDDNHWSMIITTFFLRCLIGTFKLLTWHDFMHCGATTWLADWITLSIISIIALTNTMYLFSQIHILHILFSPWGQISKHNTISHYCTNPKLNTGIRFDSSQEWLDQIWCIFFILCGVVQYTVYSELWCLHYIMGIKKMNQCTKDQIWPLISLHSTWSMPP